MPAFRDGRVRDRPVELHRGAPRAAAIAKRFGSSRRSAEELLIFTKPPYAVEPGENTEGLELLSRGVVARSFYERSVYDDRAVVAAVRQFIEAGEQARVVDHLPLKLVVIDERVARLHDGGPRRGSVGSDDHDRRASRVRGAPEARVRARVGGRRGIPARSSNFDPTVNFKTELPFVGDQSFTVTFKPNTIYAYACEPHWQVMNGSFNTLSVDRTSRRRRPCEPASPRPAR